MCVPVSKTDTYLVYFFCPSFVYLILFFSVLAKCASSYPVLCQNKRSNQLKYAFLAPLGRLVHGESRLSTFSKAWLQKVGLAFHCC